jgi:hypothetical protein
MAEKPKVQTPPYATFGSFMNFINKLQETGVPNRIDPTVFGNASGSISYSILASLKALKLIDTEGVPSQHFINFVHASDEERKEMMKDILRDGYPLLWSERIDLKSATAGQFDDLFRSEFELKGSTIDKVAAFFISAAKYAEVPISPHIAKRKPIASSNTSKKSSRQRKKAEDQFTPEPPPASGKPPAEDSQKPLEYQLIDLMSAPDIEEDVKDSIWNLVQYLMRLKQRQQEQGVPTN